MSKTFPEKWGLKMNRLGLCWVVINAGPTLGFHPTILVIIQNLQFLSTGHQKLNETW